MPRLDLAQNLTLAHILVAQFYELPSYPKQESYQKDAAQ